MGLWGPFSFKPRHLAEISRLGSLAFLARAVQKQRSALGYKRMRRLQHPQGTERLSSALGLFSHDRYKDGSDHIGEHRDDERELAPGSPIASVSFGACRDFLFRHKDSRGKRPRRTVEVVRLQLAHGSLLMMNHPTNAHWYHSLPIRKKVLAPRVNLTFRKILPSKK